MSYMQNLSEDYMRRMNGRIRELSAHTIVSFMFLGRPPSVSSSSAATGNGRAARRYVHLLDVLTRDTIQQIKIIMTAKSTISLSQK